MKRHGEARVEARGPKGVEFLRKRAANPLHPPAIGPGGAVYAPPVESRSKSIFVLIPQKASGRTIFGKYLLGFIVVTAL